jgi:hypothetical protein
MWRVKTVFLSHLYIYKRSFYQDRLGTNIGRALKKETVFSSSSRDGSRSSLRHRRRHRRRQMVVAVGMTMATALRVVMER